jgi:hypothetical protein
LHLNAERIFRTIADILEKDDVRRFSSGGEILEADC